VQNNVIRAPKCKTIWRCWGKNWSV